MRMPRMPTSLGQPARLFADAFCISMHTAAFLPGFRLQALDTLVIFHTLGQWRSAQSVFAVCSRILDSLAKFDPKCQESERCLLILLITSPSQIQHVPLRLRQRRFGSFFSPYRKAGIVVWNLCLASLKDFESCRIILTIYSFD